MVMKQITSVLRVLDSYTFLKWRRLVLSPAENDDHHELKL